MKTMNGFTNELLVKKAKRNWRTRCGAFLLAALASWCGGDALADVVLSPGAGNTLATGTTFANTPLGGNQVGGATPTGYNEGTGAGQTYIWNAVQGNSLDRLYTGGAYDGILVSTQTGTVYGTHRLTTSDNLRFTGSGGMVYLTSQVVWGSNSTFTVDGTSTGTIELRSSSAALNLSNRLTVSAAGTLNIDDNNVGDNSSTTGYVSVSGGTNAGTINIRDAEFTLAGELGGGGNININRLGMLNIATTGTISQNITGSYDPSTDATRNRGLIVVGANGGTITGNLSGSIAFDGGNRITINSDNSLTALSAVYVRNNTNVVINNANNLGGDGMSVAGAGLSFSGGGGITKSGSVGNVTITNGIAISGSGMLNSSNTSGNVTYPILWSNNADQLMDGGHRFTIAGGVSSMLSNTLHINNVSGAAGTVVLTQNNSGFDGSVSIHRGILEVANQTNLGQSNNSNDIQYVVIGEANSSERAVFRVVGGQDAPSQTITNWVYLNSNTPYSFYEVFTTTVDSNGNTVAVNNSALADASRFTVVQAGVVEGTGNLNKSGDGILYLNTSNNYQGDTVIWHGVLRISDQNAINNETTATLKIGGRSSYEEVNFRPVFETVLPAGTTTGDMSINARVVLNQTNSTIRITGENNRTRFTGGIYSDNDNIGVDKAAVLNKEGAGTMILDSPGAWGDGTKGDTNIIQGTLEFSKAAVLPNGTITIGTDWHNWKDIDNSVVYKAILKLGGGNGGDEAVGAVGINNNIILNAPAPTSLDDPASGSYIEVVTGSILSVNGHVSSTYEGSNLNKLGKGSLILAGTNNTYGGWANVYEGTLASTKADNLSGTAGVNLIGNGTTFDMSAPGSDQKLKGLKGADSTNSEDPSAWTRRVLIGENKLTLEQQVDDNSSTMTLNGAILGSGIFEKSGITGSTFKTGFELGGEQFTGTVGIQAGKLVSMTDVHVTGLYGKSGTYFDILDNTLTINTATDQTYGGTIMSSSPSASYSSTVQRPLIVKEGGGTLIANFSEVQGSGSVIGFTGNLTINGGKIVSTSDYYMEGGGKLTFGIDGDLSSKRILQVDGTAYFTVGGANGDQYSTVHVEMSDSTTGWNTATGAVVIAEIRGNEKSDYSGLVASTTDSLFYGVELRDDRGTGKYNKQVALNVTGFGGLGDTYNTRAVGDNLDNIRVLALDGNALGTMLQEMWAAGSNLTDEDTKQERIEMLRDVYQQLSADTIANAMFMGLDKPWQAAFSRLNLDSQMVYVNPPQGGQQYRGQAIANMRNLWFTPTVQSLTARSDGNARKFGIDRPGYKIGFDKRVAQNTSVGFQLGYSNPKLHQNDDRVNASDFQLGVYGGSMVGNYIELKGFIGFGHQNYKSSRNIYLPSEYFSQKSMTAHGRYDGDTFNFSFEVSRPLFLGFAILRPTIGLDSEHAFRYAFTENGDDIAMSFSRSSLSRTRARFGLALETTTLDRAIFTGRLGYSCLLGGKDYADATGQFVGLSAPAMTVRSVAVGKSYFEAGVGTRIFLNPAKTLSLVASYDATVGNRWAEHQALVGFTYLY